MCPRWAPPPGPRWRSASGAVPTRRALWSARRSRPAPPHVMIEISRWPRSRCSTRRSRRRGAARVAVRRGLQTTHRTRHCKGAPESLSQARKEHHQRHVRAMLARDHLSAPPNLVGTGALPGRPDDGRRRAPPAVCRGVGQDGPPLPTRRRSSRTRRRSVRAAQPVGDSALERHPWSVRRAPNVDIKISSSLREQGNRPTHPLQFGRCIPGPSRIRSGTLPSDCDTPSMS